mmetsp:Transcript_17828/g.39088  ORF Transcript_17828/g.39088 Transcript_17828/m.39088 type:complete len:203 (+) Transcript_17828:65-673(+)
MLWQGAAVPCNGPSGSQLNSRPCLHHIRRAQDAKSIGSDYDAPSRLVDLVGQDAQFRNPAISERVCRNRSVPRPAREEDPLYPRVLRNVQVERAVALLCEVIASRVEVEFETSDAQGSKLWRRNVLALLVLRANFLGVLYPPVHRLYVFILDDLDAALQPAKVLIALIPRRDLLQEVLHSGNICQLLLCAASQSGNLPLQVL